MSRSRVRPLGGFNEKIFSFNYNLDKVRPQAHGHGYNFVMRTCSSR